MSTTSSSPYFSVCLSQACTQSSLFNNAYIACSTCNQRITQRDHNNLFICTNCNPNANTSSTESSANYNGSDEVPRCQQHHLSAFVVCEFVR
eukprot:TRINITY_DN917_c0_g1_i4.p1 TRINITY_DN917_c0_g1~~TRINITY_DN917_c0_g1_i4.p1  ORF type:complete len:107 (+),score=11.09 TRINITY_DN917_c0_g1_i4:46-321(+)